MPQGPWKEPMPIIGWDGALGRVIKMHEQTVEFSRLFRIGKSIDPDFYDIQGSVVFRACNNKVCNLPEERSFKTKIQVLGANR